MFSLLHWAVRLFFGFLIVCFFMTFILSFLPLDPGHPVNRFFNTVIAPVRDPLDRRIPPVGMFRISYIVAFWGLFFVMQLLLATLPAGW